VHLGNARAAHGARTALDTLGRYLLAANTAGEILWSTPQAAKLMACAFTQAGTPQFRLPTEVQDWLQQLRGRTGLVAANSIPLKANLAAARLELSHIGQIGPDEMLLRLLETGPGDERETLKSKLTLTQREAEVLLWIARGKSNRDIAEILMLSPRTVNKHLEQIYAKLGVENRTSAAALAMRTLGDR
jgi:DNA-binding CsgD family transcriptional regulator